MAQTLDEAVIEFKKEYIIAALIGCRGNVSMTAGVLGVHRNTLTRLMALVGVSRQSITDIRRQMKEPKKKPPRFEQVPVEAVELTARQIELERDPPLTAREWAQEEGGGRRKYVTDAQIFGRMWALSRKVGA
jgi:hypothetical protein